jgi:hypothetical protein
MGKMDKWAEWEAYLFWVGALPRIGDGLQWIGARSGHGLADNM